MCRTPIEIEAETAAAEGAGAPNQHACVWRRILSRRIVILFVILLVGAGLRLDRLGFDDLVADEAFSWRMSRYPLMDIVRRAHQDVHPPLYYIVLKLWAALWGDSPVALRSLSVIMGLASIPLGWLLWVEVEGEQTKRGDTKRYGGYGGVLVASLLALHAVQIIQSRNVRMYAGGMALAALSAWLLWRALHARRRAAVWWTAYGLNVAALGYTHYYALLPVGGQIIFAIGDLISRRREAYFRRGILGLLGSLTMALLLFAPWIPVLQSQAARVRDYYWFDAPTLSCLSASVVRWSTGLNLSPRLPMLWLTVAAALAAWGFWRGLRSVRFLLLQAVFPWVSALAVSLMIQRSFVLDRYLFFAQFFFIVLCGSVWSRCRRSWPQACLAIVLYALFGFGALREVSHRTDRPPAIYNTAKYLSRNATNEDLIVTGSPRGLNRLSYYLHQEGAIHLQVRCLYRPSLDDAPQVTQASSILPEEIVGEEALWSRRAGRIWRVRDQPPPSWRPPRTRPDWTLVSDYVFMGGASTKQSVYLYARKP
jgi:hypothetical protein